MPPAEAEPLAGGNLLWPPPAWTPSTAAVPVPFIGDMW